jgi:hypothetical protein
MTQTPKKTASSYKIVINYDFAQYVCCANTILKLIMSVLYVYGQRNIKFPMETLSCTPHEELAMFSINTYWQWHNDPLRIIKNAHYNPNLPS